MTYPNFMHRFVTETLFQTVERQRATSTLDRVPEERRVIPLLPLRRLLLLSVLLWLLRVLGVAAHILPAQVGGHDGAEDGAHGNEADEGAVTRVVVRRVSRAVDERGDNTAQVAEADMHGDTDAALGRAADVVAIPGHTLRDVRVDTGGGEEDARVFDRIALTGDEHDKSNDTVRCRVLALVAFQRLDEVQKGE